MIVINKLILSSNQIPSLGYLVEPPMPSAKIIKIKEIDSGFILIWDIQNQEESDHYKSFLNFDKEIDAQADKRREQRENIIEQLKNQKARAPGST